MYEPPNNYSIGDTVTPIKKEVIPIKANVGKADIVVTYVKKAVVDGVLVDKLCGIKTTLTGYIEYNSTYNSKWTTKPVSKKVEAIFHPGDKNFNVDFIRLPLGDNKYKFIQKALIISVDVQISEYLLEVDESKIDRIHAY
jgi:hypothetical protein